MDKNDAVIYGAYFSTLDDIQSQECPIQFKEFPLS